MDNTGQTPTKGIPTGLDASLQEDYASASKLLQEFTDIPTIDKAWTFPSESGMKKLFQILIPSSYSFLHCIHRLTMPPAVLFSKAEDVSRAMFIISQPNLLSNKKRKSMLSGHIFQKSNNSINFQWAPFPIEMMGVSAMAPSPSGSKLLVVRNSEVENSPTHLEIWGPSAVKKEFAIPRSVHGSVYSDGWFEGISWDSDETFIAYVAEEPEPSKPTFTGFGYKREGNTDKDCSTWKGQGEWEEEWGEAYAGKRQPALFVIDINSGEVRAVAGVGRELSAGQVVWAPLVEGGQYLVFVGWPSDTRKLGIKYCYNRPCALYAVRAPLFKSEANVTLMQLKIWIHSPDGKSLIFLSAASSVDSGAHSATNSLHKLEWPSSGKLNLSLKIIDMVRSFFFEKKEKEI
ncbi:hypothetical protein OROMI_032861 [Orobanche minor]